MGEGEKLPSCVAHQVSNENTEEKDFLSQISHQANTVPRHEEESASKLKVKREDNNFAKEKIEVEKNDEHSVNENVTETRAPKIEDDQAGLFEDFSEGRNTPRKIENSSQLPHEEEICCIESKSASENSEREDVNITDQSSLLNTEKEGSIQSYKLQLTRIKELQKLVEDELEEFD